MPPVATLRSSRRETKSMGGRVGEKPPRRASAVGAQADPTPEVERTFKGMDVRRETAAAGFGLRRRGRSGGSKALESSPVNPAPHGAGTAG
jgi:hypothetical protein